MWSDPETTPIGGIPISSDNHIIADGDRPAHLPPLLPYDGESVPKAPTDQRDAGISPATLRDLALKAAYSVLQFTTEWAARQLCLPQGVVAELLEQMRAEQLLETLGSSGPFGFRYAISGRGRERAARLLEVSGYIGPAPVTLEAYTAMIEWQLARFPEVTRADVAANLSELVLPDEDALLAGLAASSGRSLFVFGPPGNGKTTLGRLIHGALQGDIWIPHCIAVEENIIRVYDPQLHQAAEVPVAEAWTIDQRWVRVRRPLIVGGSEIRLSHDLRAVCRRPRHTRPTRTGGATAHALRLRGAGAARLRAPRPDRTRPGYLPLHRPALSAGRRCDGTGLERLLR